MINAGKYRHQITIRRAPTNATRDASGRRRGEPAPVLATVWAEVTDWTGREQEQQGAQAAQVSTRFRFRYRSDVTADMTIDHLDQVYQIDAVLDFDGTKRETTALASKVIKRGNYG